MSKLIVSIEGVVVKEVQLTKARSTLGRRPYNDIVLDHLAVSGEHAVVELSGDAVSVEDLGSTNGTFVNGRPVRKQPLQHNDLIEIGRYRIQYLDGQSSTNQANLRADTDQVPISMPPASEFPASLAAASVGSSSGIEGLDSDFPIDAGDMAERRPCIRVLNGAAAGHQIWLTKPVTTFGKRGYSVAAIKRGPHGFELSHLEGSHMPTVNGVSVAGGPIALQNRDQITIGSVRLEYTDQ